MRKIAVNALCQCLRDLGDFDNRASTSTKLRCKQSSKSCMYTTSKMSTYLERPQWISWCLQNDPNFTRTSQHASVVTPPSLPKRNLAMSTNSSKRSAQFPMGAVDAQLQSKRFNRAHREKEVFLDASSLAVRSHVTHLIAFLVMTAPAVSFEDPSGGR